MTESYEVILLSERYDPNNQRVLPFLTVYDDA